MDVRRSMDALKKIPLPWIVVGLLSLILIIMLFQQRRSGYTPSVGAPMTMMDLQEFSAFTPDQKAKYNRLLSDAIINELPAAATNNSFPNYQMALNNVMKMALTMTPPPPNGQQPPPPNGQQPPPQTVPAPPPAPVAPCPTGQYSSNGNMPCKPCPTNTYCPVEGMIYPMSCPTNTRSLEGSKNATDCKPMNTTTGMPMK